MADSTGLLVTPADRDAAIEIAAEIDRQLHAQGFVGSTTVSASGILAQTLAHHRIAGQAELVEKCALIAEESRDGRLMQKSNANAQNDKRAARDFESMAIEAGLIAAEIRKRAALQPLSQAGEEGRG